MKFTLSDLEAFVAVADLANFRRAAEAVHLSQPALSRRIAKLESALGVRLFERTTRKVSLTQAGRGFMPSVERLLDDLDVALLGISEVASTRLGHVTVACVPSAAYYFMPRVIAHYHRQFPRIKVKVLDSSAHDVLSAVVNGEADFGLSFMGTLEAEVDFEPLVQEGYVVACRRDHPLAGRSSVTWDEFYRQDYISLDKTSGNRFLLDQALTGVVPQRSSICETRHVTTMIGLVEAGLGVAAVPLMAMPAADHPILTRVPLTDPQVMRSVGLIKRRGRTLTPAALELERLVVEMKVLQPSVSD